MALPTPLQAFSAVPKDQHDETQTITDGEKMTGAQALVRSLEDLGVEDVFGVPGGAILPVYDEIKDDTKFHFMLMRHEQAAAGLRQLRYPQRGLRVAAGKHMRVAVELVADEDAVLGGVHDVIQVTAQTLDHIEIVHIVAI